MPIASLLSMLILQEEKRHRIAAVERVIGAGLDDDGEDPDYKASAPLAWDTILQLGQELFLLDPSQVGPVCYGLKRLIQYDCADAETLLECKARLEEFAPQTIMAAFEIYRAFQAKEPFIIVSPWGALEFFQAHDASVPQVLDFVAQCPNEPNSIYFGADIFEKLAAFLQEDAQGNAEI